MVNGAPLVLKRNGVGYRIVRGFCLLNRSGDRDRTACHPVTRINYATVVHPDGWLVSIPSGCARMVKNGLDWDFNEDDE